MLFYKLHEFLWLLCFLFYCSFEHKLAESSTTRLRSIKRHQFDFMHTLSGVAQSVAQTALQNNANPQQAQAAVGPLGAAGYPNAGLTPQDTTSLANYTDEELQAMENGAAAVKQADIKLDKEIQGLASEVGPLEAQVKALQDKGVELKKNANRRQFEASISPEAILDSIASMGAVSETNGVFEAPIVFLEPPAVSVGEKLNLEQTTQCDVEKQKNFMKVEKAAEEFKDQKDDPQKLEAERAKLENEYQTAQEAGARLASERENLEELLNNGDAKVEKKLNAVNTKIHANDIKLEELRLKRVGLKKVEQDSESGSEQTAEE